MKIKQLINRFRYGPNLVLDIAPGAALYNYGEIRRGYPRSTIHIRRRSEMLMRTDSLLNVGANVHVGSKHFPNAKLDFGAGSYMNANGTIYCWRHVKIGEYTAIGPNVLIRDTDGGKNDNPQPVIIENDVWICSNAIILKGTLIGYGSIVGAGAVLAGGKVWPPRSLIVGNPARVVRSNIETHMHTRRTPGAITLAALGE